MEKYSLIWVGLIILTIPGILCLPPPRPSRPGDVHGLRRPAEGPPKGPVVLTLHDTINYDAIEYKYKYVKPKGDVKNKQPSGLFIEIAATPGVRSAAHTKAAYIIAQMTKYLTRRSFRQLHTQTSVGVLTKDEDISVYEEYEQYADTPECADVCDDPCQDTCTGDGRKYSTLVGLGGRRALIRENNLLCNDDDPFDGLANILVHEYAHTWSIYGLTGKRQGQISAAYKKAKRNALWESSSYAMSNVLEYIAEGTAVFHNSDFLDLASGGMNKCGGTVCSSETAARENIRNGDKRLFHVLTKIYNVGRRGKKSSGLLPCV